MLFRWITVTAEWMKQLYKKNSDALNFPYLPPENWKWSTTQMSPKKKTPYVLFKHINIWIANKDNEVAVIRTIDLVQEELQPVLGNMIDLDVSQLQHSRLIERIEQNRSITLDASYTILFMHPLLGNRYVAIQNDKELSYAVQTLRLRGSSKIELMAVARG